MRRVSGRLTSYTVSTTTPGRRETRSSGNEVAFGLPGNKAVGKRDSPRWSPPVIPLDRPVERQRKKGKRSVRQSPGRQRLQDNVRKDGDPPISLSPKLAIANYYAIRSWPEQRELCGPLAESTFGSMIPLSRVQA